MATQEDTIPEFMKKAVLWDKGHSAEEFTVGKNIPHHWGRTINEADNSLFTTLMQMYNPLYFNERYAQDNGHKSVLVNPLLVFNMVLGMSVEDLSENRGPFVGISDCIFHKPVYAGDTLTAVSEVIATRKSDSHRSNHIVTWKTRGYNQRDELVVEYVRSNLFIEGLMGD